MTVPFLDLRRHVATLRVEIDEAIARVLDEGWFVLGTALEEFERRLAEHCGVAQAVGVASGTDALTIALRAVGVAPGDEVITAANTCVPTVAGIEAAGGVPVLVDVDPATRTLDPSRLDEAFTKATRAVVPVHLYGQCADMASIVPWARSRGISVVEDAAQAHGARQNGRLAGSFGDAAAFSFYPSKNLGALGDGGAVVTDDPGVAERARLLRSYGERERYMSVVRGWNSRLDTLQAAVLNVKLGHLDAWVERRREIAERYLTSFSDNTVLGLPVEPDGYHHAYHLFVITVPEREAFRAALAGAGVQTLVHYPRPIHFHPAYEHLSSGDGRLAKSERLCARVVSLPLFPELVDSEIERVVSATLDAIST